MPQQPKLKYLFIAEFEDGTLYRQTSDDVSKQNPKKSQYYDVRTYPFPVRRFFLVGNDHKLMVDLETGLFALDDVPLIAESEALPYNPPHFDLVYYHQVTRNQNITYDTKTGEKISVQDLPEFRQYFIGWKCNVKGKAYQQKLCIV